MPSDPVLKTTKAPKGFSATTIGGLVGWAHGDYSKLHELRNPALGDAVYAN